MNVVEEVSRLCCDAALGFFAVRTFTRPWLGMLTRGLDHPNDQCGDRQSMRNRQDRGNGTPGY